MTAPIPPYVTLFQAVWWVAWRELGPNSRDAFPIQQPGAVGLPPDLTRDPIALAQSEAFQQAGTELVLRLQHAGVVATGVDADDHRHEIPTYFWQDALIDYLDNRAGVASSNQGEVEIATLSPELRAGFVKEYRWRDITVPTAALERQWPGGVAASKTKYAQANVTACEATLVKMMQAGAPTKRKADYRKDAMVQFSISGEAFNRAWDNALRRTGNTDWSKPGPKSKG